MRYWLAFLWGQAPPPPLHSPLCVMCEDDHVPYSPAAACHAIVSIIIMSRLIAKGASVLRNFRLTSCTAISAPHQPFFIKQNVVLCVCCDYWRYLYRETVGIFTRINAIYLITKCMRCVSLTRETFHLTMNAKWKFFPEKWPFCKFFFANDAMIVQPSGDRHENTKI